MSDTNSFAINKSLLTNILAAAVLVLSYFVPAYNAQLFSMGIFALSGALTNWLAVYMLFERIPFLYGSGVIPSHFGEFKSAIKKMMMEQFFTRDNLTRLIEVEEDSAGQLVDLDPLLDNVDYDQLYQRLVDAIMESSFGSMLGMFGGVEALEPLREPFAKKIREAFKDMAGTKTFQHALATSLNTPALSDDILKHVEQMLENRLQELTPEMVKDIIQTMIRKHLGWLVVWGGVFGGLIGLLVSFIS